jgi:xylose isomerase
MDSYALAYKLALKIRAEGKLEKFVADRYASYDGDYGKAIEKRRLGFKDLEKLVLRKLGEPKPKSGRQEYLENLLSSYLHR